MLEMTFATRIKQLRKRKAVSQQAVADVADVTKQAVTIWEKGDSEPAAETLRKLSAYFDVTFEWLATGRGAQTTTVPGLVSKGRVSGGLWHEVAENQDSAVDRVPVAPDPRYPIEAQYALRVEGDSVNKIAPNGSIIACVDLAYTGMDVRDGDLVVVERRRGSLVETTVKRLRKGTRGLELWPESSAPAHQEKLALGRSKGEEEVSIKALVISVTNPVPRGA